MIYFLNYKLGFGFVLISFSSKFINVLCLKIKYFVILIYVMFTSSFSHLFSLDDPDI